MGTFPAISFVWEAKRRVAVFNEQKKQDEKERLEQKAKAELVEKQRLRLRLTKLYSADGGESVTESSGEATEDNNDG
eukprot:1195727-Prorocentrum_minimum.AAC.2